MCHLKVTANFVPGSDVGTSMTHPGLQNEMKFQPILLLRIFLWPVCHLKVTANFLPGSDAGTSVTHRQAYKMK